MAKTVIIIEKEDIRTTLLGKNIEISINGIFSIVFSREALDELIEDYENIKRI